MANNTITITVKVHGEAALLGAAFCRWAALHSPYDHDNTCSFCYEPVDRPHKEHCIYAQAREVYPLVSIEPPPAQP